MKIIDRLDDSVLDYLFKTYNYNNICKVPEGLSMPWYFIPPELVIWENPRFGRYGASVLKKVDINNPLGNYVSPNRVNKTLKETTGLNSQEYFDLLVLHINDSDYRPKCPNCGAPLNFSGRILYGYGSCGHPWEETEMCFCSQSCSIEYRNNPKSKGYNNYKEFINNGGAFGLEHRHPEIYGEIGFCNWKTHIETMKSKFLNAGNYEDDCYFYITRARDGVKFGITSNIINRTVFGVSFSEYDKEGLRIIYKGTREIIADLEARVKYELRTNYEYVDWENVSKLIEAFGTAIVEMKSENLI